MSLLNRIQNSILEMEGGSFQKLCDEYLYLKYKFDIITPGSMDGTNKTTAGTPDSYAISKISGKYIMIMYGTRQDQTTKLKHDIRDVFDKSRIKPEKIERIICCYGGNNVSTAEHAELVNLASPCILELIGSSTIALDLEHQFRSLAVKYCGVSENTNQIYTLDKFVEAHDKSRTNAPITVKYVDEDGQLDHIIAVIKRKSLLIVTGAAGTGKTRLVLEALKIVSKNKHVQSFGVKSNSQTVYSDLCGYISLDQDIYVLLDDATAIIDLESVLSLLNEFPRLHFILTVRQYLLSELTPLTESYDNEIFNLISLSDKSIEKVLCQFLPRKSNILDLIIKRTNKNPRAGILVAQQVNNGDAALVTDARPIMSSYYEQMLKESEITDEQMRALFIIAVFDRVQFTKNVNLEPLLEFFSLSQSTFENCVDSLNKKEICTIIENIAVGIEDQSVQDYVLYYYLFESTTYSVERLFYTLYKFGGILLVRTIKKALTITSDEKTMQRLWVTVKSFYRTYSKEFSLNERVAFLKQFGVFLESGVIDTVDELISNTRHTMSKVIYDFKKYDGNKKNIDFFELLEILCHSDENNIQLYIEKLVQYVEINQQNVFEAFDSLIKTIDYQYNSRNPYAILRLAIPTLKKIALGASPIIAEMLFFVCRKLLGFKKSGIKSMEENSFTIWNGELKDESIDLKLRKQVWKIILIIAKKEMIPIAAWQNLVNQFTYYREDIAITVFQDVIQMKKVNMQMKKLNDFISELVEVDLLRVRYLTEKLDLEQVETSLSQEQRVYWLIKDYPNKEHAHLAKNSETIVFLEGIDTEQKVRKFVFNVVKVADYTIGEQNYFLQDSILNWLRTLSISLYNTFFQSIFKSDIALNNEGLIRWAIFVYSGRRVLKEYKDEINDNLLYVFTCLQSIQDPKQDEIQLLAKIINSMNEKNANRIMYMQLPYGYRKDTILIDSVLNLAQSTENYSCLEYLNQEDAKTLCENCSAIAKLQKVYLQGISHGIDCTNELLKVMPINNKFVEVLFDMLENLKIQHVVMNEDKIIKKIKAIWRYREYNQVFEAHVFARNTTWLKAYEIDKIFVKPSTIQINWLMEELTKAQDIDLLQRIMKIVSNNLSKEQALPFLIQLDERGYDYKSNFPISPVMSFPNGKSWSGSEIPLLERHIAFIDKLLKAVKRPQNRIYLKDVKADILQEKSKVISDEFLQHIQN